MATVTEAEFRKKLEKFRELFKKEFPKVYGKFWDEVSNEDGWLCDKEYETLEKIFGNEFGKMIEGSKCKGGYNIGGYNTHSVAKNFIVHRKTLEDRIDDILKISLGNLKINDQNVKKLYEFLEWASDYKAKCSSEFKKLFDFFKDVTEIEN